MIWLFEFCFAFLATMFTCLLTWDRFENPEKKTDCQFVTMLWTAAAVLHYLRS